ncbi:hypothetical protein MTP99_013197 [Tenebrio molitor]|nr:hypothetical protein MTP99_013197 [Tenebrio molitor]
MLHQPHLTPMQTARAIAKLKENWSLAAVAREYLQKTCIFNKRGWQENRLRANAKGGKGSLLKFTFALIMY